MISVNVSIRGKHTIHLHFRRRTRTAHELQNLLRNATGVDISDQTVRSRLTPICTAYS
jgi:hypothetical protein